MTNLWQTCNNDRTPFIMFSINLALKKYLLFTYLPEDLVWLILWNCLVSFDIKAFYNEKCTYSDFAGGEDYISYDSGIKIRRKNKQSFNTKLRWKDTMKMWRGSLIVMKYVLVVELGNEFEIYSDLNKKFDSKVKEVAVCDNGVVYPVESNGILAKGKEGFYDTWDKKFKTEYGDHTIFYDKCVRNISMFRDHKGLECSEKTCNCIFVKKVKEDNQITKIYKNKCENMSTKSYLRLYYDLW